MAQKSLRCIQVAEKGVGDWRGFALCDLIEGYSEPNAIGLQQSLGEFWELRGRTAPTPAQAAQQAYDAFCLPISEWTDYGYMICRIEDEEAEA